MNSERGAIAWVLAEIQPSGEDAQPITPPLSDSKVVCEFLRDGRALCLLVDALSKKAGEDNFVSVLPKKIQRSIHQPSMFHALERVQFFIKWCRNVVELEEHHIFTSVQLLDEANTDAVCECMDALRLKMRPKFDMYRAYRSFNAGDATAGGSNETGNKLGAFLSQFPTSQPPPTSAPVVEKTSRVAMIAKRLAGRPKSAGSSSTSNSKPTPSAKAPAKSSVLASFVAKQPAPSPTRASLPSRPPQSPSPDSSSEPEETSEQRKSLPNVKVPAVFSRVRSAPSTSSSESSDKEEPKPVQRSVSKLNIPNAFSKATASTSPPPSPKPARTSTPAFSPPPRSASKLAAFLSTVQTASVFKPVSAPQSARNLGEDKTDTASTTTAASIEADTEQSEEVEDPSIEEDEASVEPEIEKSVAESVEPEEETAKKIEEVEEEVKEIPSPPKPVQSTSSLRNSKLFAFLSKVDGGSAPASSAPQTAVQHPEEEDDEEDTTSYPVDDFAEDELVEEAEEDADPSFHLGGALTELEAELAVVTEQRDRLADENERLHKELKSARSGSSDSEDDVLQLKQELASLKIQLEKQQKEAKLTLKIALESQKQELEAAAAAERKLLEAKLKALAQEPEAQPASSEPVELEEL
ncbi:hypothetical protein Poli38472_009914 [Pythium oligandrum]|uniref:Calponin-homology (CH) domain-containing protein n=1 Tax=Pythium oligandrum TaxID=41045 RepID=A0A8K1C8R2_PYTOL|nr:hypothetical protein Poli38472_009914 [Pythium oligandrum]|eukprot:TMW58355.1 hypothetical protein Poli38472_009914 [Pythium oligandrum]